MAKEKRKMEYIAEYNGGAEEKIDKLKKILKKCKRERMEYLEGWQRARADHQNYIKQKERDMQEFRSFASDNIILQIIPILDNLAIACKSIPEDISHDNWVKGIEQTRKHFEGVLRENGVESIIAEVGAKFDPAYHEAAEEVGGSGESGTIAEVLQGGYTLNGKVIRAARVRVNK